MIGPLLIDGHVHVHECFDETDFLAKAFANLSSHGPGLPTLLLAESAGANVFARWRSRGSGGDWPVALTDEPSSIWLGDKLLVIAGRQIVTAEGVEVLALLTANSFSDRSSLLETLKQVNQAGGVAVLPWGAGKWWGRRGRMIAKALESRSVLAADIAGRPIGWPTPRLFRHKVVLAGTDPLSLPGEERLTGTFGFILSGVSTRSRPAEEISLALRQLAHSPPHFGRRVNPARFARRQLALRAR